MNDQLRRERDAATHELAERYEEISLLYAIGELLGTGASVEETARVILRELMFTIGAARGALLLDATRPGMEGTPLIIAAHGLSDAETLALVALYPRDASGVAEHGTCSAADVPAHLDGAHVLSIPIRRIAAAPGTALGTLMLVRDAGGEPFAAGDRKLVTAVAVQAGTALHNARLTRDMLAQQQLQRELQLAHELQLKLLPSPAVVAPHANAAAAVRPAVNVGGDFYALLRLDDQCTGVVIGDVSGHGVQSALVMALALSATSIHLQSLHDPARALTALQDSLWDELRSTEMSLAVCLAVIDADAHVVRYANAGHPHAFVVSAEAAPVRLGAQSPSLGFARSAWQSGVVPWSARSRLLLFTDGIVDARHAQGGRLGEEPVVQAAMTHATPEAVVHAVFAQVDAFTGGRLGNDDLAIVVVDRPPRAAHEGVAGGTRVTGDTVRAA